jgi:Fe-Mn family superoxide dismutase
MAFKLPPLPYAADALEPHVSARTLELHHGKHHKAYIDKTNELITGTPLEGSSLVEVIRRSRAENQAKLCSQAGQAWNHTFFWQCMSPTGGGRPGGEIAARIEADLGGYDTFIEAFRKEAVDHFASGWAWLVLRAGRLEVMSLHDGDSPVAHGDIQPVLTLDVWEHAYYLDYQNKRPKFVQAFLDHLINWQFAEQNLDGRGAERADQ